MQFQSNGEGRHEGLLSQAAPADKNSTAVTERGGGSNTQFDLLLRKAFRQMPCRKMSLSILRSIKITFPLISQVLMDTIKEKLWGQLCLAVQAQQRN